MLNKTEELKYFVHSGAVFLQFWFILTKEMIQMKRKTIYLVVSFMFNCILVRDLNISKGNICD